MSEPTTFEEFAKEHPAWDGADYEDVWLSGHRAGLLVANSEIDRRASRYERAEFRTQVERILELESQLADARAEIERLRKEAGMLQHRLRTTIYDNTRYLAVVHAAPELLRVAQELERAVESEFGPTTDDDPDLKAIATMTAALAALEEKPAE